MKRSGTGNSGDGEGEGYLASVSDLMSGLMFVFIIMLVTFALMLAEARKQLETETKTAQDESEKAKQERDLLTSSDKVRQRLLETLRHRLETRGLQVEILEEHGVLSLDESHGILFDLAQPTPRADHLGNVGILASVLAEVLPCYVAKRDLLIAGHEPFTTSPNDEREPWCGPPAVPEPTCPDPKEAKVETLLIEGHTDSKPLRGGRFRNNVELSAARAADIYQRLRHCEPDLGGLGNRRGFPVLSVAGFGPGRPSNVENTEADENRRIDLRFLMELPGKRQAPDVVEGAARPIAEVDEKYREQSGD